MCIRPLYFVRRCEKCDHLYYKGNLRAGYEHSLIPCGKCIECVKKRQNDIVVRTVTESQNYATSHFVTLTYDDDHLPIASSLWCVDSSDCVARVTNPEILDRDFAFTKSCREYFKDIKSSPTPRYLEFSMDCFENAFGLGSRFFLKISPSLYRRDVRLWIKNCRVSYERKFGKKLNFSFLFCGEYGGRSCRPHYHLYFLGLTDAQIAWMCKRWESEYGFTLWKSINNSPNDKFAVARYVSKYMTKGKFECESVKCGDVEKPRYSMSQRFGFVDTLPIPYFYCYDLVGVYNPDTLRFYDGKPLTEGQILTICKELPRRMCCHVPGSDYLLPLPQSWKNRIYYIKKKAFYKNDGKIATQGTRYVPTKIFKIVQTYLMDEDLANRQREFEQFAASQPSNTSVSEMVLRFNAAKESNLTMASVSGESALVKFYSRDSF